MRKGYIAHARGRERQALDLYNRGYLLGTKLINPLSAYAILLMRYGCAQDALTVLEYALSLRRNEKQTQDLVANLGLAYWKTGQLDEAISIYEQLNDEGPNVQNYGTLGFLYIERDDEVGDYEESLAFNQKAMAYDDGDAVILDNMGQIHYRMAKYDEAKAYFERALAQKEDQFDSLVYLAKTHLQLGDTLQAKLLAQRAQAIDIQRGGLFTVSASDLQGLLNQLPAEGSSLLPEEIEEG